MENEDDNTGSVSISDHDISTLQAHIPMLAQTNDIVVAHACHQPKQMDSSADGDENESAEVTQQAMFEGEDEEQTPLSYELQEGWKLLDYFLRKADPNLTGPFVDAVDDSYPETQNYYDKIKEPVWLTMMQGKFLNRQYNTITEFVTDFRRMIYNCCSFNGMNHPISRKAMRLLVIFSQKLNLLKHDIRVKTTEEHTTPWLQKKENQDGYFGQRKRVSCYRRDDSSEMRKRLREEEEEKARAARRQKREDRCAAQLAAHREMLDWEDKNLTFEPIKTVIKHSWELPQIGILLFLCGDILNLDEVPIFELERCLAMPRQSLRLQQIMTSLLSTPYQRERSQKKIVLMPYNVWTEKLAKKMDIWYKVLDECHGNINQSALKLGLEKRSFEIIGLTNPLREKSFHKLGFYRKIWILKSLCDYLMETQESLCTAIETTPRQTDQRQMTLGTDRFGNVYIHFPQFCGEFLRVYRQKKLPVPALKEEMEENDIEQNLRKSCCSTPVNDSEVESTASSAPSETKTRTIGINSRHSSPMPKEPNGSTWSVSSRGSPAPDPLSHDGGSENIISGKRRKTRNSAESTFFSVDLEELLRRKSRRGKGVKNQMKETVDMDKYSNGGDDSSWDVPSSTNISCASNDCDHDVCGEKKILNGSVANDKVEKPLFTTHENHLEKACPGMCTVRHEAERVLHSSQCSCVRINIDSNCSLCDKECVQDISNCCSVVRIGQSSCFTMPCASSTASSGNTTTPVIDGQCSVAVACDKTDESVAMERNLSNQQESIKESIDDDSGFASFQISPAHYAHKGFLSENSVRFRDRKPCENSQNSTVQSSNNSSAQGPIDNCVKIKAEDGDITATRNGLKVKIESDGSAAENIKKAENLHNNAADNYVMIKVEVNGEHLLENGVKTKPEDDNNRSLVVNQLNMEEGDVSTVARGQKLKSEYGSDHVMNEKTFYNSGKGYTSSVLTFKGKGVRAVVSALMDHDAYSEEELMPDPDEFELIVDDMDSLEELIKKFTPASDEASSQVAVTSRSGKRQKSRLLPKAVKRWNCEKELYEALNNLKNTLDGHKAKEKLVKFRQKYHAKMRQEFEDFVEEVPQAEESKEWETESEKNSEESSMDSTSEDEESDDCQDPLSSAQTDKKEIPAKSFFTSGIESSGVDHRGIEDYEEDVSSRGRLRKRRLIPNNIEDQGVKKKKVIKKVDVLVPVTVSNHHLSSQQGHMDDGKTSGMSNKHLSLAANRHVDTQQKLSFASHSHNQGPSFLSRPQVIKCPAAPKPGASTGSDKSAAHPVIQRILSGQRPLNGQEATQAALQQMNMEATKSCTSKLIIETNKRVMVDLVSNSSSVAVPQASGVVSSGGLNKRGHLLLTASGPGGKQQVFKLTAQQEQELIRRGILQYQVAEQTTSSSIVSQTPVTASTDGISNSSQQPLDIPLTDEVRQIALPQNLPQVAVTATMQDQAASQRIVQTSLTGQSVSAAQPCALVVDQSVTAAQPCALVAGQTVSPEMLPVSLDVPASGHVVSPAKTPRGVKVETKPPMIVSNSSGSRTLVVYGYPHGKGSSRYFDRYAGGVTVKRLLEDLHKSEDTVISHTTDIGQTVTPTALQQPAVVVTPPSSVGVSSSATVTIMPASMVQHIAPATLKIPSQSSLDEVLQTVVTSYHTTLPTVDIKVPSPTTLPSLSPRKNVTRTVQSNKFPIFTTSKLQTEKKSVTTLIPAASALTLGANTLTGIVSGLGLARPGTIVVPAQQNLSGADIVAKKRLLVIPQAAVGAGGVVQRLVVPAGTSLIDASTLQLINNQSVTSVSEPISSPVTSLAVSTGETQVPGCLARQDLLMAAPSAPSSSSSLPVTGSSQEIEVASKTASEMLKNMLAAKMISATAPSTQLTSVQAIASGSVASSSSIIKSMALLASAVTQQSQSLLPNVSPPIKSVVKVCDITGRPASGHQISVSGQDDGLLLLQMQQQGMSSERIHPTSASAHTKLQTVTSLHAEGLTAGNNSIYTTSAQDVVCASLPAGVQMSGIQPGAATVKLFGANQTYMGSAGNRQTVLATVRPGTQDLLQLQQLIAAGGLQLFSQQQQQQPLQQNLTLETKAGGGPVIVGQMASGLGVRAVPEQPQQTVKLCFKMQPNRQIVVNPLATSVIAQPVLQSTDPATLNSQNRLARLVSPSTNKVIMANQATSVANPATFQLSAISNLSTQPPNSTPVIQASVGNQIAMTVNPGPMSNHFIISSVPAQSLCDAASVQLNPANRGPEYVSHNASPVLSATPVQVCVKRSLPSSDIQPIPAKMAHLDGTTGINSGALLASLSQLVGSNMNRNPGQTCVDTSVGSPVKGIPVGSAQRVVHASALGDVIASCSRQNLTTQLTPGTIMSMAKDSAAVTSLSQGIPTQMNVAQILQHIAGVAPGVSGIGATPIGLQIRPQQAPQQQQILTVRRVGGQLLTPSNVPVTVSNGEVKVLPKVTLQLGTQTITVLSPSSALIHNLRNPVNSSTATVQYQTTSTAASSTGPAVQASGNTEHKTLIRNGNLVAGIQGKLAHANHHGQEMARAHLKPEIITGGSSPVCLQLQTESAALLGQQNSQVNALQTVVQHQTVAAGTAVLKQQDNATLKQMIHHVRSTPVLKVKSEKPVAIDAAAIFSDPSRDESVKTVTQNGQEHFTVSSDEDVGVTAQDSGCASDTQAMMEEEAALNLLTLANQR